MLQWGWACYHCTMKLLLLVLLATTTQARERRERHDVAELRLPDKGQAELFSFGPGDRFSVAVYPHADLNAELTVAPDGTVTFPLIGRVQVAGRDYTELVQILESSLHEYYTDASVAVNVVEITNRKVFVVGEVDSPSVLQITGELTVLEALIRTGGINPDARTDNLLLVRGDLDEPELYTVDVRRLLDGDMSQNAQLRPNDIIVVPAKTIVNAERFFRRVQGILGPFVGGSQIYRNLSLTTGQQVIDDTTSSSR